MREFGRTCAIAFAVCIGVQMTACAGKTTHTGSDTGSDGGSIGSDMSRSDTGTPPPDGGSKPSDAETTDMQQPTDTAQGADADTGLPPTDPDPVCQGGVADGALPDGTIAGEITTPYPTLQNLTVEWAIEGDDDLDGVVRVRYREQGATRWRRGMDLRRIPAATLEGHSWVNRHSGSVLDLEPGRSYEIELWLQDPDGGCRFERVTAQTRPLPEPMVGAPVKQADPGSLGSTLSGSQPGDIIELAAGDYSGFQIPNDGAPGREIVIRSNGGAVVNGTVNATGRQYVQIVGLTANRIRFDDSNRVSIMNNTVNYAQQFDGIGAWNRAENAYIADNVVNGVTNWNDAALGVNGANEGECILVTGPGHVVSHNRITGCRDNISFMEGDNALDQFSIDVIGNDIYEAADDGVEADFCAHNCRILRNRFTNVFIAMSSQPGLGGPTYFVRNVVYSNLYHAAFKLHRGSIGDVILHNTVVKMGDALGIPAGRTHARQYFRNNLFIGGAGGMFGGYNTGDGSIVYLPDAVDGSYDYDGLGSEVGDYSGRIGDVRFADFAELRSMTTYEHAVQVGLNVFATDVSIPTSPFPGYDPVDMRLAAGSAAEDAGLAIPNVNDGYAGAAPDLGAYELGASLPVYGPR